VVARYYNWLSWFQRITSWVGQGGGYQSLTVHRQLKSSDPAIASADVVHERILAVVGPFDFAQGTPQQAPRVIDAGCGLGGTILYLHRKLGGEYHGLTVSPTQRAHAEREAKRRRVAQACHFHLQSYDDDPGGLLPSGADLVVAIESLAHSPDPVRSIANLARALRTGGRLVVVDDVPDDGLALTDDDFTAFRAGWRCPAIARRGVLLRALSDAGLAVETEHDLTPLVALRDPHALERLAKSNRRWRAWAGWTGAGELIDSLYGGLMLERLYRRGLMQYRLVAARRTAASG
jgi:tocopherol O-methyltransferase